MTRPDFTRLTRENIVAFIGDIFDRRGDDEYLGEPVTMAQHMLQGATIAAQNAMSEEIVVAALLHDIGHFTSEFGTFSMDDTEDRFHEEAGAELLEQFFPSVVTDCVRYHVAAKRYLCATKPEYFKRLSEASIHSLNLQGGPMGADEVAGSEESQPEGDRAGTLPGRGRKAPGHGHARLLALCPDGTARRRPALRRAGGWGLTRMEAGPDGLRQDLYAFGVELTPTWAGRKSRSCSRKPSVITWMMSPAFVPGRAPRTLPGEAAGRTGRRPPGSPGSRRDGSEH